VWVEFVNGKLSWKARIPVDYFSGDSRAAGPRGSAAEVPESVLAEAKSGLARLTR
jgi:hypothetical protein